jgi:fimbrial chaperone protein
MLTIEPRRTHLKPFKINLNASPVVRLNSGSLCRLAVMALGCLLASAALSVTISPVKVVLSAASPVVTITVTNDADLPMIFQSQVLAWTQMNGEDHLEESTDLLVAPAIARIEPHGTQIFRVMQRYPTLAVAERAYRLVLDDISATESQGEISGVNFVFSHRLPVFVAGTGEIGPKPQLVKCPNSPEPGCVRMENTGDQYVKVHSLTVSGRNWQQALWADNRILAGAWQQWTFATPPASAGRLRITAETSAGRVSLEFPNSVPHEPH